MGITKNKQSKENLNKIIKNAYPNKTVASCTELTEGLCNVAYHITFTDGYQCILKIAAAGNQGYMSHEINLMDAEVAAMGLVQGQLSARVARIDLYDNTKTLCSGNYFFMEVLEGENYFKPGNTLSAAEKEQINLQIGRLVREITSIMGETFGLLGDREHTFISHYDFYRYLLSLVIGDADRKNIEYFIAGQKLLALLEQDKPIFEEVQSPCLIHYDLWDGNIFVKNGQVSGLIDWERALWGDSLMEDRFRRHARNDAFLKGYGQETFTTNEMRRIYWYDILLYLIMMTEGAYREYEDDSQYQWVAPLFQASLQELTQSTPDIRLPHLL